jgi:hypothetical protein
MGLSLLTACVVVWVAAEYGSQALGLALTGKAIGTLAAGALFGTMFGGHAVAAYLTLRWADVAAPMASA